MIKDTNEQPDEELHGVRSARAPSPGASVPVELGYATHPIHRCVHQPGNSPNAVLSGIFMEASSYKHNRSLIPFSREWGWD